MKLIKRCIFVFLSLCLGMSLTLPCFATSVSNINSSDQINTISPTYDTPITFTSQNIEPRAAVVPTQYMNLSYSSYTAKLVDLAATRASLTKYYFSTGTRQLNLDLELVRSGTTQNTHRVLAIYLYQKTATGNWEYTNRKVAMSFSGTTVTNDYTFYNLDPNKFYYISFKNESATSSSSRMDISGTIVISE